MIPDLKKNRIDWILQYSFKDMHNLGPGVLSQNCAFAAPLKPLVYVGGTCDQ